MAFRRACDARLECVKVMLISQAKAEAIDAAARVCFAFITLSRISREERTAGRFSAVPVRWCASSLDLVDVCSPLADTDQTEDG